MNCASEMRRRPPSVCASSTGTVMQKAKVRVSSESLHRGNYVSVGQHLFGAAIFFLISHQWFLFIQAWESKKGS